MKKYFTILLLILLSCQNDSKQNKNNTPTLKEENVSLKSYKKENLDTFYNCESTNFISVLEEIPNRNSNAYKITIISKNGKDKITKILDTRPEMSKIKYCNDLYTVVGFSCGGPCYSQVFVFTDKNRPTEQYSYVQKVKNNPNIIAHIKNEEFEKLIIHNFLNSKELIVDLSDINRWNYGQMDSILIKKDKLILYYLTVNNENTTKTVALKTIL